MVHPCCGFPLRNGTIIVAIINIIGSIFGTVSSIIQVVCVSIQKEDPSNPSNPLTEYGSLGTIIATHRYQGIIRLLEESDAATYYVLGFVTLTCLVELLLTVILLKGAQKWDSAYCKIWWRTKLVIFLASTAVIIFAFVIFEDRLEFAVVTIVGILYQMYGLWVVKAFISELEFPKDCEQKGIEKL